MTDDQEIEALRTAPIVVPLTRWERVKLVARKVWRIAQPVCAVISLISLVTALVGVVLVIQLAICTNKNLGARNAPNAADRQALALLFSNQAGGLQKPIAALATASTGAGKIVALRDIGAAFHGYSQTVNADNATRDANPIGKC